MRKAWRVIIIIVLVAVLLGAVSVGVGIITGAERERMEAYLDTKEVRFGPWTESINTWYDYITVVLPKWAADSIVSIADAFLSPQSSEAVSVVVTD